MYLDYSQEIRFGEMANAPKLVCSSIKEAKQFQQFFIALADAMNLCDVCGAEKEWNALYDKLADIEIVQDEQKDDMSTARPITL